MGKDQKPRRQTAIQTHDSNHELVLILTKIANFHLKEDSTDLVIGNLYIDMASEYRYNARSGTYDAIGMRRGAYSVYLRMTCDDPDMAGRLAISQASSSRANPINDRDALACDQFTRQSILALLQEEIDLMDSSQGDNKETTSYS